MKEEHKNYIISIALLLCTISYGRHSVSGYINVKTQNDQNQKVSLSRIDPSEQSDSNNEQFIASTSIGEDGFFAFDQNLFKSQDHIYKIQLNPLSIKEKKILSDKVKHFKLFILSKKDTIHFYKGSEPFVDYTTNNSAELEWQKLRKFETKYENLTTDFDPKQYLMETKGYVKDSLQILLVKLIGIKRLDDQNLLEKDVKKNPDYYLNLLKELKTSDINPEFYIYLENRLTSINQDLTNQKYTLSLWGNGIALLIIIGLCLFYLKSRRKNLKIITIPLSKQEEVVKNLIASGKSNKEIANELFISLSTVKTHITNIYSKLNISNRKELLQR